VIEGGVGGEWGGRGGDGGRWRGGRGGERRGGERGGRWWRGGSRVGRGGEEGGGVGDAEDGGVAEVGEGAVEGLEAELELEAVVLAEVVAEDGEGEVAGGAEVVVIVVGGEGSLPGAEGLPDQEVAVRRG